MSKPSVAYVLAAACVALMALATACEKVKPSETLEGPVTPVGLVKIPNADIAGTAVDQYGTSLAHARISMGVGDQARIVQTDATGSYRFTDVAAGAYVLTGSKDGYVPGRARVTLDGRDVTEDIVLPTSAGAPSHRAETAWCAASGELTEAVQIRSQEVEGAPTVELQLSEGTVVRDASGKVASGPIEIAVTPLSGEVFSPPEPGTFGVTEPAQYVPGERVTTKVDVDLGDGVVAEDVEISEPNPMLAQGSRVSAVTPMAAFLLEPEGLTFENPDGTPRPQRVVFGNLPLGDFGSPGTSVELVDRGGNVLTAAVGPDGRSVEGLVSRLARYDLLTHLELEVLESSVSVEGVPAPAKLAETALVIIVFDTNDPPWEDLEFRFPQLDDPDDLVLAQYIADALRSVLEFACYPPGNAGKKNASKVNAHSRIEIRIVGGTWNGFETFAIVNRWAHKLHFTVKHEEGVVEW